jgi:hypothetical protein
LVFARSRVAEGGPQSCDTRKEVTPQLRGRLSFSSELFVIRSREAVDYCGYCIFQLPSTLDVIIQHAYTQRTEIIHNMISEYSQRLGGMASNQNLLALSEQMTNKVCYGVTLTSSGRALDQDGVVAVQLLSDTDLFSIRGLAQQNILRFTSHGIDVYGTVVV